MFYHLKKFEVSISSDSKDTTNRTITFFLKTPYKSRPRHGIIPRQVKLTRVSNCAESVSPGYHTPGSHRNKFFIKSPRGRKTRRVKLTRSHSPASQSSGGVNSHFFTLFHRPLKRQWHKNK